MLSSPQRGLVIAPRGSFNFLPRTRADVLQINEKAPFSDHGATDDQGYNNPDGDREPHPYQFLVIVM